MWLNAESLAARTFPATAGVSVDRLQGDKIFALALSVIGVLLAVEAIPILASSLALFGKSRQGFTSVLGTLPSSESQRSLIWTASAKATAAAGLVRLAIGLILLAGPRKVAGVIVGMRRERIGALEESEEEESNEKRGS